jgi:hypothetical protein
MTYWSIGREDNGSLPLNILTVDDALLDWGMCDQVGAVVGAVGAVVGGAVGAVVGAVVGSAVTM